MHYISQRGKFQRTPACYDYHFCCRSEQCNAESDELRLLRDALSLSIPVLNLDPSQLSAQLLSRLMPYITDNEAER